MFSSASLFTGFLLAPNNGPSKKVRNLRHLSTFMSPGISHFPFSSLFSFRIPSDGRLPTLCEIGRRDTLGVRRHLIASRQCNALIKHRLSGGRADSKSRTFAVWSPTRRVVPVTCNQFLPNADFF
uniref:Secreted protein n=1 Tax=Steinernema glaseri TaxID=37863 RepID=A0A1I7YS70_9BILA